MPYQIRDPPGPANDAAPAAIRISSNAIPGQASLNVKNSRRIRGTVLKLTEFINEHEASKGS